MGFRSLVPLYPPTPAKLGMALPWRGNSEGGQEDTLGAGGCVEGLWVKEPVLDHSRGSKSPDGVPGVPSALPRLWCLLVPLRLFNSVPRWTRPGQA